ncbi:MAG: VIT1/CCC1 transporter family protein [Patescibacteria group bacterium]
MKKEHHHKNPNYIHHNHSRFIPVIRELVFGMEDGMVSTVGAVTGIAAGTQNHYIVVLSGLVIVAVESISMGVGSYLSTKSKREVDERKLAEEQEELEQFPSEEKKELEDMYVDGGWPDALARDMAEAASKNKTLFLNEMAYRELHVFPGALEEPVKSGVVMGVAYVIGGSIPLVPYLFFPLSFAGLWSIFFTLGGLFLLGSLTTKFSKRAWWRAGFEMLLVGGIAIAVGYGVGRGANALLSR